MGLQPIGTWTDLVRYHDYIEAVLTWVGAQIRAGKSRDEILAMREPLAGFEDFGPVRESGRPGNPDVRLRGDHHGGVGARQPIPFTLSGTGRRSRLPIRHLRLLPPP